MTHFCESEYFICTESKMKGSPLTFSDKEDADLFSAYVSYCPMCGYKAKVPMMSGPEEFYKGLKDEGVIT